MTTETATAQPTLNIGIIAGRVIATDDLSWRREPAGEQRQLPTAVARLWSPGVAVPEMYPLDQLA